MESKQLYLIHRNKHREAAKMRKPRSIDQMKKTDQNSKKKKLNEMEISNLSVAEFKTLVIRMLKELSEDLNSMKKIQSKMKDTLIEIKNNLQGNISTMDKAEIQINDLGHNEAKNNQSEQQEKKNPKKTRII